MNVKQVKIREIVVYDGLFPSKFDGAKIKGYSIEGILIIIDFKDGSRIVTNCRFVVDIEYRNED